MDAGTKAGRNGSTRYGIRTRHESQTEVEAGSNLATRYSRLFEASPDGILILDATTGRIMDANPFMTHLLGFSHEQFIGKQLWEVGLLRDADRRHGVLHDVSDLGVIRWEELLVQSSAHPEGMDVEVVSSAYRDGDHQLVQCRVRDITERKRANLSATLQAEERTVADRHKNEFLAMLSHELRNAIAPVANALMVLRLSQESESNVPNRARTLIERQVGHLSHLVDDLQEISSIGTGRMRLQPGVVDLRLVVERSVEGVMSAHAHRKHQVALSLPDEPVWLDADAIRLEQVVVNLLSNAANYTPDGGNITVAVSLAAGKAELRVADNGIGIAPEMLTCVFDLFIRADGARNHAPGGLGIGLNVVRQIVEMHGGSVGAKSGGEGAGSEFIVSLPLAPATA
ncbi:MAG TPA: PAS domain-containing sensor histidine kinase [Gemmatimonadaceae bacterium]